MGVIDLLFEALQLVLRETSLFAAVGFLVLGTGDVLVDLTWLVLHARRIFRRDKQPKTAADLPAPSRPGRFAVFVPAWDESAVVGDMLRHALDAFGDADYRLYVGCYPNDPATIAAVGASADPRIRRVIGPHAGPTSKADCLNRLWTQMLADEAAEGFRFKAVVLHDAEDIVHSAELPLFVTGHELGRERGAGIWRDTPGRRGMKLAVFRHSRRAAACDRTSNQLMSRLPSSHGLQRPCTSDETAAQSV